VLHSSFVPSRNAETGRNAFVSRRTCGKLPFRIPAMDPVAFGTAAISLGGTRRSWREAAVASLAGSIASALPHSNARCYI